MEKEMLLQILITVNQISIKLDETSKKLDKAIEILEIELSSKA